MKTEYTMTRTSVTGTVQAMITGMDKASAYAIEAVMDGENDGSPLYVYRAYTDATARELVEGGVR